MAERRMFAKTIVTSDSFLDMPATARCLYFTLGMFADDDGFVNNPKSIMRQVGATSDDMNILIAKKFVILFDSGVIVIKHWRIHNYIQNDRYHETKYKEEKGSLTLDENNAYSLETEASSASDTKCIQGVSKTDTEDRIGKVSIGNTNNIYGQKSVKKLKEEFETLWGLYPKKQGRKEALEKYIKYRKEGTTYEEVEKGILAYESYIKDEHYDAKYIKKGSTFFNQKSWEDDWSIRSEHADTRNKNADSGAGETDYSDWSAFGGAKGV